MDAALPGVDSLSLIKRIRQSSLAKDIPVIMKAKCSDELEIVRYLDSGADDCLGNPFGMMEMVSRVRAVLRRSKPQESHEVLQAENIVLSLTERSVSVMGQVLQLSYKEFELLRLLMKNCGIVISRDVIMERVWDSSFEGESRTIDVHVRSLRQKLGACGAIIKTVRNVGYMADVQR